MTKRAAHALILALCALFAGCGDESREIETKRGVEPSGLKITAWNLQWFPGKTPSGGSADQSSIFCRVHF